MGGIEIGLLGFLFGCVMATMSARRKKRGRRGLHRVEVPLVEKVQEFNGDDLIGLDDFNKEFDRVSPGSEPLNPYDAVVLLSMIKNVELASELLRNKIYQKKHSVIIPVRLVSLDAVAIRCIKFLPDEVSLWEVLGEGGEIKLFFSSFPKQVIQMDGVLYLQDAKFGAYLIVGKFGRFCWTPINGVEPF